MLKIRIFDVFKLGSHRKLSSPKLYLHLNGWSHRDFLKDIPILGWDCIGHDEWDSLCDSVRWSLEHSRKKGHRIIDKEDEILKAMRALKGRQRQ